MCACAVHRRHPLRCTTKRTLLFVSQCHETTHTHKRTHILIKLFDHLVSRTCEFYLLLTVTVIWLFWLQFLPTLSQLFLLLLAVFFLCNFLMFFVFFVVFAVLLRLVSSSFVFWPRRGAAIVVIGACCYS